MKKKIAFLLSLFAVLNLFLAPVLALASYKPATLVNYKTGYRVAVYNQEQSQRFFSLGYELDKKLLGFSVVTNYATTLSTSITSSQTTLPVGTTKDKKGIQLATSTLGMKIYLNIEPGGAKEEIVVCTGISGDTWTGCTRGLAFSGTSEAAVPSYQFNHSAGSKVVMSNIHYVYQQFVDKLNPLSETSYTPTTDYNLTTKTWVENRNGYWEGSVANFAALPLTNNADGAARVTLDDSKLYVWSASSSSWNLAGAGGGAGTVYITTKLGTESTGDDNKTFTLNSGSFPDKKYLQTYLNGILMEEGASADYVATSSNAVIFNDAVLDTDKITLIVVSVDLYNPAWNNVNGDVLPDVDSAYNIGTTSKKFKDLNLSGNALISGNLGISGSLSVANNNYVKFGGDGSDGDLVVAAGATTTLDFGGQNYLIKNYKTVNIAGVLTATNTPASGGILILRSAGEFIVSGKIDLKGKGATAGTTGYYSNAANFYTGSATSTYYITNKFNYLYERGLKFPFVVGSGGGTASQSWTGPGCGNTYYPGGVGGNGGGSLFLELGGKINITGYIDLSGNDGQNGVGGSNVGVSGGGGGASGNIFMLYNEGGQTINISNNVIINSGKGGNATSGDPSCSSTGNTSGVGGNGGGTFGFNGGTGYTNPTWSAGGAGASGASLISNGVNATSTIGVTGLTSTIDLLTKSIRIEN